MMLQQVLLLQCVSYSVRIVRVYSMSGYICVCCGRLPWIIFYVRVFLCVGGVVAWRGITDADEPFWLTVQ